MIPTRFRAPEVDRHGAFLILRDDLLAGGTKRRAIPSLFSETREYVYASPAEGYAQIALAIACAEHGKKATVFVAKRDRRHERTAKAAAAGATIFEVEPGYLATVQARAREYAQRTGAAMLPFGLNCEAMLDGIAGVARALQLDPPEVWCASGSGTLTRGLQRAWPRSKHFAVQVGKAPNAGAATLLVAPERFHQNAQRPPPFPSCSNYDAKVWRFFQERAVPGALFWNVGA